VGWLRAVPSPDAQPDECHAHSTPQPLVSLSSPGGREHDGCRVCLSRPRGWGPGRRGGAAAPSAGVRVGTLCIERLAQSSQGLSTASVGALKDRAREGILGRVGQRLVPHSWQRVRCPLTLHLPRVIMWLF
jgi:hypothetical protein